MYGVEYVDKIVQKSQALAWNVGEL
jgi:hypothetical protein